MGPGRQLYQYLPRFLLDAFPQPLKEACVDCSGATLFTDIKGFSRITESYAGQGPEGAERLAMVLDNYFGRMTDITMDHGGDVVDFVGDALVAIWRDSDLAVASDQAVACGLALQHAMADLSASSGFQLQQRIAVSAGLLRLFVVSVEGSRRHLLVAGQPMVDASYSYRYAGPGEVVVCAPSRALLKERYQGRELPSGHMGIGMGTQTSRAECTRPAVSAAEPPGEFLTFLPPMAARQVRGEIRWPGEFRTISTAFFRFPAIRLFETEAVSALGETVSCVQRGMDEFEGSFERLSTDDKGVTALTAFGLPLMAHEDDPSRVFRASMAIRKALEERSIPCSVGITRGRVFYGDFGSRSRRHVGLVGEPVNLAARLMMASNDIRCDVRSMQSGARDFRFETCARLQLAEKAETVSVYTPTETLSREIPRWKEAIVGRGRELGRLEDVVEGLRRGIGDFCIVRGDPGIGKSRLLAEAIRKADESGIRVLECAGAAIDSATPYYPWRTVLVQALTRAKVYDPGEVRRQLHLRLENNERLLAWLPLLNDVLPLAIPENDISRAITGTARASSIQSLLSNLILQVAEEHATLLVADDLHWFDEASIQLLELLRQELAGRPAAILGGSRPAARADAPVADLLAKADGYSIVLGAFSKPDICEFIASKLDVTGTPDELVDFVFGRAGGHALYTEELLRALLNARLVRVEEGSCRLTSEFDEAQLAALPATIEGVIVSHFDRLSAAEQTILKCASVVGREFSRPLLLELLSESAPDVDRLITTAIGENFIVASPAGQEAYAFRHAILRDAIYDLLPFAERRSLHRRVAEWNERQYANELDAHAAQLAYHWEAAAETVSALDYLERAAVHGIRQFANREAIRHIRHADVLAERQHLVVDPAQRSRWEGLLGEAHHEIFEYGESPRHFLRSLELMGRPAPRSRAGMLWRVGAEFGQHLVLRAGLQRTVRLATAEQLRRASHSYVRLGESAFFASDQLSLLHHTLASLNLAERSASTHEIINGFGALAIGFVQTRLYALADFYHRRSVSLARAGGQLDAIAFATMLGMVYRSACADWSGVGKLESEAAPLYRQLGHEVRWQQTRALIHLCLLARGRFDDAEADVATCVRAVTHATPVQIRAWLSCAEMNIQLARGTPSMALVSRLADVQTTNLMNNDRLRCRGLSALALWRLGDRERAVSMADATMEIASQALPNTWYAYDALSAMGEVYMEAYSAERDAATRDSLLARAAEACKLLKAFVRLAPPSLPRALTMQGRLEKLRGRTRHARRLWTRALREARRLDMPFESAIASLEIGTAEKLKDAIGLLTGTGADYHVERARAAINVVTSRKTREIRE